MKAKRAQKKGKQRSRNFKKIMIITLFIVIVAIIINTAPNYCKDELEGKLKVMINQKDVTTSLKYEPYVDENNIVYFSSKDIANFFDENIFYDNQYNQIITGSDTKIATLKLEEKSMYINSSEVNIYGAATRTEQTFYLPFSEMETVYNIDVVYHPESQIITIDSLDREQKMATSTKDTNIKYKPTFFSKTLDTVKKGSSVILIEEKDGWAKVRTAQGKIGYTKDYGNIRTIRDEMKKGKQIEGNISMVWDYYSEYVTAPTRTEKIEGINVVSPTFAALTRLGKGKLDINIGQAGENYITWAHNNDYKVWAMVSNNSMKETTSEILNDYALRETLINNIVALTMNYEIDGINIDFENIYEKDKDMFSRFIIELAPRLREYGRVLSVDVTAPDGSEDWSLCYDRHVIGKEADYIVFMGYDQYGATSPKEGTTAGGDWVETNIKKFLGQEEVEAEKLILGIPFYTRLWKEQSGEVDSSVVSMKNIDTVLPTEVQRNWNEDLKQNYVEYTEDGIVYKMWIEDINSLKERLNLVKKYELAGAAYWEKDMELESVWSIIAEELQIP